MTTYSKASLKTFFETGDVPTGQNYSDFIDSYINIVDTSAQQMNSSLEPTELIAPRVSATNVNVTGTFSASNAVLGGITTLGRVVASAATVSAMLSAGSLNVDTDVSAGGTIYSSAMRSGGFIGTTGVVSAAGSTQATAALLTNVVNRGKGIVDGTTTGYTPLTNRPGLTQYLFNEGASANLWPPTGGIINGLAANAAFPLAASAMVTIVHLTASAYAVK